MKKRKKNKNHKRKMIYTLWQNRNIKENLISKENK